MIDADVQEVIDALAKQPGAVDKLVASMTDEVAALEVLGLDKEEIARRLGLIPARRGRPTGSRTTRKKSVEATA